jgi:hypothetical protein
VESHRLPEAQNDNYLKGYYQHRNNQAKHHAEIAIGYLHDFPIWSWRGVFSSG